MFAVNSGPVVPFYMFLKVLLLLSQSFSNLKLDDINFFVFLLTWILVKLVLVT